ncbi:helicase associated domain-containing protein [Arthrobacter sp. YAF16]|uniref:helicase associated domain-containing protein n=1 Tax=Arthrobacter sp. YAF16 TaxID=3233076 RepID=UPI003F8F4EC5
MDRLLRRAPDAEWVLMYRLGLSRKRIAALVCAEPNTVGYHLAIARRQDPGLEAEHQAADPAPHPSPKDLARMEVIIAWVSAEGRLPQDRACDRGERSMARWLSGRRREAAAGTLDAAYRNGLAQVPGWQENRRKSEDEARWHRRLDQLVAYREEGHDWPRHHDYDSEREHTLGVWIHTQRYKHRRGELDSVKFRLLDDAVPGWQTGRTRGRPRRPFLRSGGAKTGLVDTL